MAKFRIRTYTKYTTWFLTDDEEYLEMGAQWIHGEVENVVFKIASARALYLRSNLTMNSDLIFARSSGEILRKEMGDRLQNIMNTMSENFSVTELRPYQSSGDFFVAK